MYKIRKIRFKNHPVLKNLAIDFCGKDGRAVDTIIIAGENGTGKSTVLNALYSIVTRSVDFNAVVEYEIDSSLRTLNYSWKEHSNGRRYLYVNDGTGLNAMISSSDVNNKYPMAAIFSDVDINFHSNQLSTVTSLNLDEQKSSRRSSTDLPTQINQLLIDIQALDDADVALAVRENPELKGSQITVSERMPRFTRAFNRMFDGLSYSRIENREGHKVILFSKNGSNVPIDALSSGEKQIVYRGCFLLKDVNALNGAFVFLDEPEISLHPKWQMKIMDYYKSIFTDDSGNQTSQIIAVTHSPFIIHNENRKNDKVIILDRNENGEITIQDKPEYYKCNSVEAIQDAFSISSFSMEQSTVYLEGRTDEKYFNKALEVFNISPPFRFKWIGYIDDKGEEVNTGSSALNQAVNFLIAHNLPTKNVCLFDCDVNKNEIEKNNVVTRNIPKYENSKKMKKGIENALILDSVDTTPYYTTRTKEGDYGDDKTIKEFKKMEFCDYICSLSVDEQKIIFGNLKNVIENLIKLFD